MPITGSAQKKDATNMNMFLLVAFFNSLIGGGLRTEEESLTGKFGGELTYDIY